MKKVKSSWLVLLLIMICIAACSKEDQTSTTSLKIRLIDSKGNSLSGAEVMLYVSSYDMELSQNQVRDKQVSDVNGEVSYSGLEAAKYYWFAQIDCLNNMNGIITTDKLTLNNGKVVTSTLSETGSLYLKNSSPSQYDIFLDGTYLMTADGLYECTYKYILSGTYTIMVSQVGGSATKSFKGTISCSETLSITYP